MQIIAHRGASAIQPENTLAAFAAALAAHADGIEFDVRIRQDELIIFHDDTLERVTNGHGRLHDLSLTQLRDLDAGHGERIPLLAEALLLIDATATVNLELKDPHVDGQVIAMLRTVLARSPRWAGKFLLSSFDVEQTFRLATYAGPWRLGVLFKEAPFDALARALACRAYSLHLARRHLTAKLVDRVHAQGLRAYVYTVNDTATMAECLRLGVDAIFTDHPARARAFLDETMR